MLDANLSNTHRNTKCKQMTKNPECPKNNGPNFFDFDFTFSILFFIYILCSRGVL
jgi:hypothetical protein